MFFSAHTGGFYAAEIHVNNIPSDAVEITESEHAALLDAQSNGLRIVADDTGRPIAVEPPQPTLEQIKAEFAAAVQTHMDSVARSLGYDDIKTAVTYADEPAVPKFQAEGQTLRAWRSRVWDACYAKMDVVMSGADQLPSVEDLIASLPAFEMPGA
ncbi:MAG: hypothetical protein FWD62_01755 [Betaproteobacteria bacterium]|nr:hypothetical protein [Betaproteobacteria bacterium]